MDFERARPEEIARAIVEEITRPVTTAVVGGGGAARAAAAMASLF
jgi:hypothetical protein